MTHKKDRKQRRILNAERERERRARIAALRAKYAEKNEKKTWYPHTVILDDAQSIVPWHNCRGEGWQDVNAESMWWIVTTGKKPPPCWRYHVHDPNTEGSGRHRGHVDFEPPSWWMLIPGECNVTV